MPGPGIYFKDYNLFYTSSQMNDQNGHCMSSAKFNANVYVQVPRFIWFTDTKFLGADVGCSLLVPVLYQNISAGPWSSSKVGVGDVMADGILGWHTKQFDFVVADGIWMPTGDSAIAPTADAGTGFWTDMVSAGATWHMDTEKTWALSVLNRYEFNSEQRDTHVTPGEAYTMEWGLSKTFIKTIDVGMVGYYQDKVTTDSGGMCPSPYHSSVAAVGPEIRGVVPGIDVQLSLRYEYEFMAEDRAQGQTITFSVVKAF